MLLYPGGSLVQEANHMIEALTYRSIAMLINFIVENVIELRKVSVFLRSNTLNCISLFWILIAIILDCDIERAKDQVQTLLV